MSDASLNRVCSASASMENYLDHSGPEELNAFTIQVNGPVDSEPDRVSARTPSKYFFHTATEDSLLNHPSGFQNILPLLCALSLTARFCSFIESSANGSL